ncbi:TIGR02466 family protein [Streptomyces sp. NPDC006285]|uniref:TIGR02466 family protein n=1 Tax=Streptomyces sp. NPDC006285 TaxID=3364742 RepID=UPI0036B8106E
MSDLSLPPQSWATPVLVTKHAGTEAVNKALLAEIRSSSGEGLLTIGVEHASKSNQEILRSANPAVGALLEWIFAAAHTLNEAVLGEHAAAADETMIAEAWAVVYQPNGYHRLHSHPGSAWSGVYYVDTGDLLEGTGLIEFIDPRTAAIGRDADPVIDVVPEAGMLVAFPSWLVHDVSPVVATRDRICIAFNIGFEKG